MTTNHNSSLLTLDRLRLAEARVRSSAEREDGEPDAVATPRPSVLRRFRRADEGDRERGL